MRKTYPKLPTEIAAPAGRVTVEIVALPESKDEIEMGHFHLVDRTIRLKKGMRREQQWRTYFHECAHVWLADSGLSNGLPHDVQEAICDAVGSGLFQERFG